MLLATLLCVLLASNPGWTQQPTAPQDTSDSLRQLLEGLESGDRVRLHLPGTEPVSATLLDATGDSLRLRGDLREAQVATSRIERLEVARRPYWKSAGIGAAAGAVIGGVIAGLSTEKVEFEHTGPAAPARAMVPVVEIFMGIGAGYLAGGGIGALVATGITDWERRYPAR